MVHAAGVQEPTHKLSGVALSAIGADVGDGDDLAVLQRGYGAAAEAGGRQGAAWAAGELGSVVVPCLNAACRCHCVSADTGLGARTWRQTPSLVQMPHAIGGKTCSRAVQSERPQALLHGLARAVLCELCPISSCLVSAAVSGGPACACALRGQEEAREGHGRASTGIPKGRNGRVRSISMQAACLFGGQRALGPHAEPAGRAVGVLRARVALPASPSVQHNRLALLRSSGIVDGGGQHGGRAQRKEEEEKGEAGLEMHLECMLLLRGERRERRRRQSRWRRRSRRCDGSREGTSNSNPPTSTTHPRSLHPRKNAY